jgi:hypothetical protein
MPRHILEYNIKVYIKEIRLGNMNWIDVAQDRDQWGTLVNTVINLQVP